MILRWWFRFLGFALLALVLWASLLAGFQNLNPFAVIGRSDWPLLSGSVVLSYGLLAVAIWMIRGGPQLIRKSK